MRRKFAISYVLVAMLGVAAGGAWGQEHATRKDAEAMVKKGVAFIKSNGKEKGYAEISNKQGQFSDRDLLLIVYRLDGTVLAHGGNEKMIGRNLIDLKDLDGRSIVRERVEMGKTKGAFWQEDYKFSNPKTKMVGMRSMYCERSDDTTIVCGSALQQ